MAEPSELLIAYARSYLRISHKHFDTEIADLIAAARADLKLAGIRADKADDDNDPLTRRAVMCYLKAEFGLDNDDAERYRNSYEMLKRHLALADEYIKGGG